MVVEHVLGGREVTDGVIRTIWALPVEHCTYFPIMPPIRRSDFVMPWVLANAPGIPETIR